MTLDLFSHSKTKTPILFFVIVEIIITITEVIIVATLRPSLMHHRVHYCCIIVTPCCTEINVASLLYHRDLHHNNEISARRHESCTEIFIRIMTVTMIATKSRSWLRLERMSHRDHPHHNYAKIVIMFRVYAEIVSLWDHLDPPSSQICQDCDCVYHVEIVITKTVIIVFSHAYKPTWERESLCLLLWADMTSFYLVWTLTSSRGIVLVFGGL